MLNDKNYFRFQLLSTPFSQKAAIKGLKKSFLKGAELPEGLKHGKICFSKWNGSLRCWEVYVRKELLWMQLCTDTIKANEDSIMLLLNELGITPKQVRQVKTHSQIRADSRQDPYWYLHRRDSLS